MSASAQVKLTEAVRSNDASLLREAVREGADPRGVVSLGGAALPDARAQTTSNLLSYAASLGFAETVEALLEAGAEPRASDEHGREALSYAAGSGSPRCVEILLQAGGVADARDPEGLTPLDDLIQNVAARAGELDADGIENVILMLAAAGSPPPNEVPGAVGVGVVNSALRKAGLAGGT